MRDGKLTHAWVTASASLPLEWELYGVAKGPRQADPIIRSDNWVAWAKGPDGVRAEGTGETPEAALYRLAERLAGLRGSVSG